MSPLRTLAVNAYKTASALVFRQVNRLPTISKKIQKIAGGAVAALTVAVGATYAAKRSNIQMPSKAQFANFANRLGTILKDAGFNAASKANNFIERHPSINKRTAAIAAAVLFVVTVVSYAYSKRPAKIQAQANIGPSWHQQMLIVKAKEGNSICMKALSEMHAKRPVDQYDAIVEVHGQAKLSARKRPV